MVILSAIALALPADYFIRDTIDISSYTTNPQVLEVIPGGFIVIDWESAATTNLYILDSDGNLMNETDSAIVSKINMTRNATHLSTKITGIRVYNSSSPDGFGYAVLDNSGKNITTLNSSDFTRVYPEFNMPNPGNFGPTDNLAGFCTNTSDFWVITSNRDVITNYGGGGNNSLNLSEFTIPGTNNAGGIDCFQGNLSELIILDDTTGIVYHTTKSAVLDFVNLSSLASQGINTFSDIALLSDPISNRLDFYAINNNSKLIYHIRKRPSSALNVFAPAISWTYPPNGQAFNTRFASLDISFNFTVLQPNSSASEFTDADVMNCSIFINGTYNISTLIQNNNISINYSINVSSVPLGPYKIRLDCLANNSYAKTGSDFKIISVNTFKHILWIGDNFTLYYDSDVNAFKASLGANQTKLIAPFNITKAPVAIRITFDNATGNRSIYINGVLKASDLLYNWNLDRQTKMYLLSRNYTGGQANAVLAYVQTSQDPLTPKFKEGSFITSWITSFKNLVDTITASYFFQFRAVLKRSITSDQPVLRFVNISFDDTLMNFTIVPDVNFLDFSFDSGDSPAVPVGQTSSVAIFKIENIGNKSFDLEVASLTPFSSCFTAGIFNFTDSNYDLSLGGTNNTVNLSTTYQRHGNIAPGESKTLWVNVSASGCTANSEFFDIDFRTSP